MDSGVIAMGVPLPPRRNVQTFTSFVFAMLATVDAKLALPDAMLMVALTAADSDSR